MNVLIVSDIHSNFRNLRKLLEIERADVIAICGDITDFNYRDIPIFDEILESFEGYCLAVHGNCDDEKCIEMLKHAENVEFIHGKRIEIEDYTFYGLGGSTATPFFTPSEYSEEYYYSILKKFDYADNSILISHSPPYGILDRTYDGVNAGSLAIRDFMSRFDYIFCGHIHESYGIKKVSETLVINAGALSSGIYAKANLRGDVSLLRL